MRMHRFVHLLLWPHLVPRAQRRRHHAGITVCQQRRENLREILRSGAVQRGDLGHGVRRDAADVRRRVAGRVADGEDDDLEDNADADGGEYLEGEGADEGGGGREVLLEGVHGEEGDVGVLLGVVHEVEVDEFFDGDGRREDVFDDVGEKLRRVFAEGDEREDAFERVGLELVGGGVEAGPDELRVHDRGLEVGGIGERGGDARGGFGGRGGDGVRYRGEVGHVGRRRHGRREGRRRDWDPIPEGVLSASTSR
mmetsp:Transcript_13169/g.33412  ORF Transcript_13169/g.33412 Transcript_13169/m.33412 type:complete len:253 (+) Transcript_13169:4533-5291(+)